MPQFPIEIHPKFERLLYEPHRYANIYGGRYGMKSMQVQKCALIEAINRPMRICEARETMSSIRDSSHKELADTIHEHGMAKSQNGPFEIQERRIIRRRGDKIESEFLVIGIREDVRNNKSLKGIDLTIVEEAAKVSQDSWNVLRPTVMGRKEGSRLWAMWNPELTTDPTWKLFMLNPPSGTIHIHTSYLDNDWLTESARIEAEDMLRTDPKLYKHIFMGEPIKEVEGAIFGDELKKCEEEGRICGVPYDPTKPVHTAWDLGFGDLTCIWFVQARDGHLCFIDYVSDRGKTISEYLITLRERRYMYGEDVLPHDAIDNIIHRNLLGPGDQTNTIPNLMRAAGRTVRLAPKLLKVDALNAGRTLFALCRFDAAKCADGIMALRHYQWDREEEKPGKRKPLHDQYSHGADAFLTAAVSIKRASYAPPPVPSKPAARMVDI